MSTQSNVDLRHTALMAAGFGAFVALFLLLFQPFGLQIDSLIDGLLVTGIGLLNAILIMATHLGLSRFAQNWPRWAWHLSVLMTLLVANFVYLNLLSGFESWSLWQFFELAFRVVLVGLIPTAFVLLYRRLRQAGIGQQDRETLSKKLSEQSISDEVVTLTSENERDVLRLSLKNILFLQSADNYAAVHHISDGETKRELLRGSLAFFESQLNTTPMIRCHRSYIVNLAQATKLMGNAQGMQLQLRGFDEKIPVSRKYIEAVKTAIEQLG